MSPSIQVHSQVARRNRSWDKRTPNQRRFCAIDERHLACHGKRPRTATGTVGVCAEGGGNGSGTVGEGEWEL